MTDRDAILLRFTEWLDQALAAEEPPRGIPEELLRDETDPAGTDLYSMQAAVTALTQEVKLQGRSFKQLSEAVAPALQAQISEMRRQADERAWREVLDALLDLRDRLSRGLDTAQKAGAALEEWRPRWWESRRGLAAARQTVAALLDGYRLTAERADEILHQLDVREIDCLMQPFDPQSMRAIEAEETARVPEGTVVEVYRPGYEWKGRTYRPAEVKVARPHAGAEPGDIS